MIVEGQDARYRSLTVGEAIRDAVRQRLSDRQSQIGVAARSSARRASSRRPAASGVSILSSLDMSRKGPKKGDAAIEEQQGRLNLLERKARAKGVSTVLVFEGCDAAGKGGAIRRVTAALDARDYRVIPIAAPTDEERAQHYLWRFWRHLGRAGGVTLFDRSWYGRVLVERVEGFASEKEWMRAYAEINQFEDQLADRGIVVVKYWLHVTKDEQLRRFKEREATPYKQWKLTPEDWRNREKWPDYERAVNDMIERTSTRNAPWTLVEANDKNFARIKVLKTVCDRLEKRLERT
jgi:AMP-polyphosphate phosphotransferase